MPPCFLSRNGLVCTVNWGVQGRDREGGELSLRNNMGELEWTSSPEQNHLFASLGTLVCRKFASRTTTGHGGSLEACKKGSGAPMMLLMLAGGASSISIIGVGVRLSILGFP